MVKDKSCGGHIWTDGEKPAGLPRWHSGEELSANAGDIRDANLIPGLERFLGVGMATHSSIPG